MALHPKLIDLKLDRLERILGALGNPHEHLPPVVHVAGTNGKGSVIAYMRAALLAAGYRVHVYTSPHLVRFHERVEIDGEIISEDDLAVLLDECERENGGEPITFFEVTTAAAFLAFSRTPADVLLLETGLGGRLDATNVVAEPLITIVTPVSLDHQQFLGQTIAEIAGEKAGIIKQYRPFIMGPQQTEAAAVLKDKARVMEAPATCFGDDFRVGAVDSDGFELVDGDDTLMLPTPILAGPHQPMNAATAAVALRRLEGFEVSTDAIARGLQTARWPARLQKIEAGALKQRVGDDIELWLDGGHNPAAGEILAEMARSWSDRPLGLLVGMMNTKDPAGFIAPLAPMVDHAVAVGIPGEKNTLAAEETFVILQDAGVNASSAESLHEAIDRLAECHGGPSRILVCGSLYLAGRFLAANDEG
tara:strand:- start:3724 stop:4983 length:1260 start_codon:yes stop_codon:yes gene_type:complete